MKIHLYLVLLFILNGCNNSKSNDKEFSKDMNHLKVDSNLMDKKKVQLIETVLNLPNVIRFSKLKFFKKNNKNVYILLKRNEFIGSVLPIVQDGKMLSVLNDIDSLDTTKQPCYIFTQLKLKGDTAFVQIIFDITGLLVSGNLNYIKGQWVPDNDFIVGVR